MKKIFFTLAFLLTALAGFSQRMSVVAVFPFEFSGPGLTAFDAGSITDHLVNELESWGTLSILSGGEADKAEYLVKGGITRQNNRVVLTASTYDAKTNKVLNTAREEGETPADILSQMFSFAAQVTENVPFPNYLLGKWRCVIPTDDGPLTCILEFRSGRVLIVEQYDTWEQRGNFTLRYQGFGTGSYSYWGHARRTVRGSPVDGFVSISLKLEDALTRYVNFSISRQNLNFDDEKNYFELLGTGFACGEIYRAPESAKPESSIAYTRFVKIQ
ncbi:MAG: hypothetical protein LBS48_01310 [Treponema sp.]|jgi:TolB-like protein|nr:hypothetical protein [Treponema sp.]